MIPARFEVLRVRRGSIVERFHPNMAREDRPAVRAMVDAMREDARRWGDVIRVRRIRA